MEVVGDFSFEVVESTDGLTLQVRVVDSQRGCGFDIAAKPEELYGLAKYLMNQAFAPKNRKYLDALARRLREGSGEVEKPD